MADYISREAAYPIAKKVVDAIANGEYHAGVFAYDIMDWIDELPAADVQEVRSGKWMYDDDMNTGIYAICSCCKESIYQAFEFYYCPNCGARMEREE